MSQSWSAIIFEGANYENQKQTSTEKTAISKLSIDPIIDSITALTPNVFI